MTLSSQFDDDKLYHGTAGPIVGDYIRPSYGRYGFGAYAVYGGDDAKHAQRYARMAASDQGRLFGTVYEVTPRSKIEYSDHDAYVSDPEGLDVVKAVDFPPSWSK